MMIICSALQPRMIRTLPCNPLTRRAQDERVISDYLLAVLSRIGRVTAVVEVTVMSPRAPMV